MDRYRSDTVDNVAADIDDLQTTVDEVADNGAASSQKPALNKLQHALDLARDAIDEFKDSQSKSSRQDSEAKH